MQLPYQIFKNDSLYTLYTVDHMTDYATSTFYFSDPIIMGKNTPQFF